MNRFVLDDEDIIILGEKETQNDTSNSLDRNSVAGGIDNDFNNEQTTEVVNGGPGSGNFGHSGRPGEVGGSAPRGSIAQPASRTVTAKWLSEHREFLKSQGYTDDWINEQIEYLGQQKLKERATKAKTLEEFDEVLKEMEASPHDFSVWKKNVGDPARASLERRLELKSKVKNPEQQKAVDDLKATGIDLPKASEKWLRENCPQELVESITSSMKQAEKDGLDLSEVRLKMTETTTRGGSCTVDLDGTIKVFLNKNDYFDLERTASRNSKLGPDGSKWWTNGKLDSCASHELGHALTWQVLKNQGMSPYRFKTLCKEIVSLANDRFARESGEDYWSSRGKLSSNENNEYMSRYGGKNSAEVIAESHSNPSYSRYTQIVNEILIQSIKGEIEWK